jgi:hypothetical protein
MINNDGTLRLAPCSFTNKEAIMIRKRVSSRSELPLEHHWQSKVRKVMRKARNSRERADRWGNELARYLSKLSL